MSEQAHLLTGTGITYWDLVICSRVGLSFEGAKEGPDVEIYENVHTIQRCLLASGSHPSLFCDRLV